MKKLLIYIMWIPVLFSCRTVVNNDPSGQIDQIDTVIQVESIENEATAYYAPDRMKYSDAVYLDRIESVQLHASEWVFGPAVIPFGSDKKLTLSFDELSDKTSNFYFSFILCDAMWQPVDLMTNEFLEGFDEEPLSNYTFSMNTLIPYIHYSVDFPTENMKPKKSGNYILQVYYYESGEKKTAITKRFFVTENSIGITTDVKNATNLEQRNYQHEIDFMLNKNGLEIVDPYRSLTVVVQQNGRTDNPITTLKPKMVNGDLMDYNFESGNIFDANNEFRHFDAKSIAYYTDRISSIKRIENQVHVYLKTDYRRPFDRYMTEDDINGRFLIKNDDDKNSDTESEYVWVHFLLSYDAPLTEGSVFLQGAFTQWGFSEKYKLNYDFAQKGYADSLLLKQGYYNYQYVFLKDGETAADAAFIEGRHAEADNDYTIYVYYREPGEVYDRLLGVQTVNSRKK